MPRHQSLAIFILSAFIAIVILSISILMTSPNAEAMPTLAALDDVFPSPTLQYYIASEHRSNRDPVNQFIVQFDKTTQSQSEAETLVEDVDAEWIADIPQIQGAIIEFGDTPDSEQLEILSSTLIIEPNYMVQSLLTYPTNDPMLDLQWAWQKIDIPRRWSAGKLDTSVTVAIIDSGVCFSHPDLQGRFLDTGYDFVDNDNDPSDQMGHGCAISGIIAANLDNGMGIAGIAPNVNILPIRVLDAEGIGTYADVMSAIFYAVDNGADIINLSLGGQNHSQLLEQAINYAVDNGVQIVAGTGNTGQEGVLYPARYAPVIAVGSHNIDGNRSSFSTYGAEVDVLAPGENIVTTNLNGEYSYFSGTSMAAPHVSALLALSDYGTDSVDFVAIMPTVDPLTLTLEAVEALEVNTNTPLPSVPTMTPTSTRPVPTNTPAPFVCEDLSLEAVFPFSYAVTIRIFNSGYPTTLKSIEIAYPSIAEYPDLYIEGIYFNAEKFWQGDGTLTPPMYIDENVLSSDGVDRWNPTNPTALYNEITQFDLIFGSSPDFLDEYWTINDLAGTKLSFYNPADSQSPCVIQIPADLYQPPPTPTPASHLCSDLSVTGEIFAGGSVLNFYLSNGGGDTDLQSIDWHFANANDPNAYIRGVSFGQGEIFWDDLWLGDETSISPLYMDPNVMSPDGLYYWQFADLRLPHNTTKTLQLVLLNVDVPMRDHWSYEDFSGTTFSFYNPVDPQSPCTLIIPQDMGNLPTPTPISATAEATIIPTLIPTHTPTPTAIPIGCENYAATYTLGTVQSDLVSDLRRAVECANQSVEDNTIDLNGQTVSFNYAPDDYIYSGFNALPPIESAYTAGQLTIQFGTLERVSYLNTCVQDVTDGTQFRLFVTQPDSHLNLSNISIRNGCAFEHFTGTANNENGGGILNFGNLDIENSIITLNQSTDFGGGIFNSFNGIVTITDSTIDYNSAKSGAGIFNEDNGQVSIADSTVTHNTATSSYGGGIMNYDGGQMDVTNTTISYNSAKSGAGIYNYYDTEMTIIGATITGNISTDKGGGIFTESAAILDISTSVVNENSSGYGGGIYNDLRGSQLIVTDTTIYDNTASITGGGIYNGLYSQMTMTNSTIYKNSAANVGGGLFIRNDDDMVMSILNTTITENTATNYGGGLYISLVDGDLVPSNNIVSISNSIIANTSDSEDCYGSTLSFVGMNLIEDGSCDAATNGQLTGDPKLDPAGLQLATGSMPTIPLLSDSPAIDAGDDTQVTGISYDQRGEGFPRIFGSHVDLGAYEYQPIVATNTPSPTPTLTPSPTFTPTLTFTPLPALSMTNISATFIDETTGLISWSDDNSDESGYRIMRRVSDTWSELDVVAPNLTTYYDAGIDCGRDLTYDYQIQAYRDVDGDQAFTDIASLSTDDCPFVTPNGLSPDIITDTQIGLSWTDNSILESNYIISRKTTDQNWTQVANLAANTTTYTDTSVECERQYQYRLYGYQALFDRYTEPVTTTVMTGQCAVAVPDTISTTITSDQTSISWNPIPPQQTTQIIVERAEQESETMVGLSLNWQIRATLAGGTSVYTDDDMRCGMIYSYRLRGYNERHNAYTGYTDTIQVNTDECPVPVTNTIGLYHNGRWAFREGFEDQSSVTTFRFGPQESGWIPLTGDWDGDGVDGIGIYKDGVFALRDISDRGASDYIYRFGSTQSGWQPIVGDWDADGVDSVGLYREGRFMLTNSNISPSVDYQFTFGRVESGWQPIAGDWFNHGRDYVGIYRDGVFNLHNGFNNSPSGEVIRFGSGTGWIPVAGDWDADGYTTIGLYKDNNWRLSNTNQRTIDIGIRFSYFNGQGFPLASYRGDSQALALFAVSEAINITHASQPFAVTNTPESTFAPTEINVTNSATNPESTPTFTPISGTEVIVITSTPTAESTHAPVATASPTLEPTLTPTTLPTSTPIVPTTIPYPTQTEQPSTSEPETESTEEVSSN